MSMSKKDFIALADAMQFIDLGKPITARGPLTKEAQARDQEVIESLCDFMRSQNPAFMRDRWLDYLAGNCGPSGGTVKKK